MNALRELPDGGFSMTLHVQPGAKWTEFAGVYGEAIKIRLAAPPVDGKANACLIGFLADFLRVPKRLIELTNGEASRSKVVKLPPLSTLAHAKLLRAIEESSQS